MDARQYFQRIPRPLGMLAGGAPPWATRPKTTPITTARLRTLFGQSPTDFQVAPSAAVLAPMFDDDLGAKVMLIRRSSSMLRDPGHIALPGGRIEVNETPQQAALREAEEEIGLMANEIDFVAALPLAHRVANYEAIAPFVGLLHRRPQVVPNEAEVDAIFEVSLSSLLVDGVGWEEIWERNGTTRSVKFFADPEVLGDNVIWGLTAHILWTLLDLITADFSIDS